MALSKREIERRKRLARKEANRLASIQLDIKREKEKLRILIRQKEKILTSQLKNNTISKEEYNNKLKEESEYIKENYYRRKLQEANRQKALLEKERDAKEREDRYLPKIRKGELKEGEYNPLKQNEYRFRCVLTVEIDENIYDKEFNIFNEGEYVKKKEGKIINGHFVWQKHFRSYSSAYFKTKQEAYNSILLMVQSKIERVKKSGCNCRIIEPEYFSIDASNKERREAPFINRHYTNKVSQKQGRKDKREKEKGTWQYKDRKARERRNYRATYNGRLKRKEERKKWKKKKKKELGNREYKKRYG